MTALQTTFEAPAIELSPRRTGHRLPALDALRLVAAVAVVAFHFTAYPAPQWGRAVSEVFPSLGALTSYGAFGVQLFFVISGFVILMSAWGRTIPSFVASRVSRIYPAYWTAVILAVFLFRVLWPEGKQVSLHQALVNLTMMQTGFGVSDVDGVYWTLWTELCFYIIIAVFMRVGITTSRVLVFCAAWPLLSTFAAGSDNALVVSFFMPRHAALFAGGMVLHVIYREGRSLIAGLVLALDVIVAGHATYAGWFHKVEVNTGRDLPDATVWLVVLACFGLVALATLSPLRNVRSRWLTRLGLLTYPLYLVHQYWGLWIIQHLYPALPGRLVVGIAFAATVLLALAVHHVVERRFATPFRRALEGSMRRLGAAARPARS